MNKPFITISHPDDPRADFLRRRLADAVARHDWKTVLRLQRWLDFVLNGTRYAPPRRRA
jgi:hypothetical protein